MTITTASISVTLDNRSISDTDMTVCNAARQSMGKQKPEEQALNQVDKKLLHFLATGLTTADWANLLDDVLNLSRKVILNEDTDAITSLQKRLEEFKRTSQHWTPFAHPSMRLRIVVPVFLARQLVKHQIGGVWSEESRRYIDEEPVYYIEPILHKRPEGNIKQGSGEPYVAVEHDAVMAVMRNGTEQAKDRYMRLIHDYKLSPEEAREILPLNHMTSITWTGNLLFFARVFNQRFDPHAQHAARRFALLVERIVQPMFPASWEVLTGRTAADVERDRHIL